MADKQKVLPYKPIYAEHKLMSSLYWLVAIGLWPLTVAVILIRLSMRISKPQLRYLAFTAIAMLTLFNGVLWAAMYAVTNSSNTSLTTTQHQAVPSKPASTASLPKPATTQPISTTSSTAPTQQSKPAVNSAPVSASCDASLWNHIYHSYRLKVFQSCTTVTGTIVHIIHEKDGDTHIRLKLDSAYISMLNSKNISAQYGDLVLEPVCEEAPTQTDAISACTGYRSNVVVPADGTHVSVTGSYVLDTDHGWNEIHPVTSITTTP